MKKNSFKLFTGIILTIIPYIIFAFPLIAKSDNKRLLIGLELFPSFLASDHNIKNKKENDQLTIVVVYQYNKQIADDMASRLQSLKKIRGIPFHVMVKSVYEIQSIHNQIIAGVFVSESMISLEAIIKQSIVNQFIVFSPFEGDIEKGATGGIYITEKIVPYLNMSTLHKANIQMKSFFLRVAKKYE